MPSKVSKIFLKYVKRIVDVASLPQITTNFMEENTTKTAISTQMAMRITYKR